MHSKIEGSFKQITFYTPDNINLNLIINKQVATELVTIQKQMAIKTRILGYYMTTLKSLPSKKWVMFYGREGAIQVCNPNTIRIKALKPAIHLLQRCYVKYYKKGFTNISNDWLDTKECNRKIPITLFDIAQVILHHYND